MKIGEPVAPKLTKQEYETKRDELGGVRREIKAQTEYINELERTSVAKDGYVTNETLRKMSEVELKIEEAQKVEADLIKQIQPELKDATAPIRAEIGVVSRKLEALDQELDKTTSDVEMLKIAEKIEPLQKQLENLKAERNKIEQETIDRELEKISVSEKPVNIEPAVNTDPIAEKTNYCRTCTS